MTEIKKGALVKAWDDDAGVFTVGVYQGFSHGFHHVDHMAGVGMLERFENAIEMPPELAAQLESLGYE